MNNLIAIIIHICLCLFILPSVAFIIILGTGADPLIFALAAAVPHTLIVCGLYFLAGRLFLHRTKSTVTGFISVMGLFISLIILVTFLTYIDSWAWTSVLLFSFAAIGIVLTNFKLNPFIFIILSLLPPLMMLAGLRSKSYVVSTLEI
jgi:hypothetical protein